MNFPRNIALPKALTAMTNDELRPHNAPGIHPACEQIFQLHKRHIIVNWNNHTGLDIDRAIEEQALNELQSQNIIFRPNPSDSSITQINPILTSASSYNDALNLIKEKRPRTPVTITPVMKTSVDILEPAKKKKPKTVWIIIAIMVVLFLLFEFVPFSKWL